MKLIFFIIFIIIAYIILSKLNILHIESLPDNEKTEAKTRAEVKKMLVGNHIPAKSHSEYVENRLESNLQRYSSEQFDSNDYTNNYWELAGSIPKPIIDNEINPAGLPNASNLLELIRSEYQDDDYRFNLANLPVTSHVPNKNTIASDRKFMTAVERDIYSWNKLFQKYYGIEKKLIKVKELRSSFIQQTADEFMIVLYASLMYLNRSIHFKLQYYGQILRNDEFLNNPTTEYPLQLVDIQPIKKVDFNQTPVAKSVAEENPFLSMSEQLAYVDRINELHLDERGV